jgi:polar amino acid transport system permease protein
MRFDWQWDFTIDILPRLIEATGNTILAAAIGYLVAMLLGLVFALAQRTRFYPLTRLVREFIEFIRTTPLLVQIFAIFYILPQFGIVLSPWVAGMTAIGLHYSTYISEVYRAGLDSVPRGQFEAAKALNLSVPTTYIRIIIPQALPPSIPAMGNYLVAIFKDTPILSVIGVAELVQTANEVGTQVYRFLEPYTLVGLIFLILSISASSGVRVFEGWIRRRMALIK